MNNKLEIIDIYIKSKDDLIDKFDNNKLSEELSKYIYNKCFGTPLKHNVSLNIICDFKISMEDKEKITDMIRSNYGIHISEYLIYLKYHRTRDIYLFIIGVILICISRLVNHISDFILGEILLIIGWVAIWEATYNFIFDNNNKRIELKRLKKLTKCKINFK